MLLPSSRFLSLYARLIAGQCLSLIVPFWIGCPPQVQSAVAEDWGMLYKGAARSHSHVWGLCTGRGMDCVTWTSTIHSALKSGLFRSTLTDVLSAWTTTLQMSLWLAPLPPPLLLSGLHTSTHYQGGPPQHPHQIAYTTSTLEPFTLPCLSLYPLFNLTHIYYLLSVLVTTVSPEPRTMPGIKQGFNTFVQNKWSP